MMDFGLPRVNNLQICFSFGGVGCNTLLVNYVVFRKCNEGNIHVIIINIVLLITCTDGELLVLTLQLISLW